eukprot:GHVP01051228.1.p1 GENE.GHVP01051228.1~~GHVP01051228.1.p1  ORF type:complete len:185 (+),score=38.08 GHVP01051228.1:33-557(+)
MTFELGFLKLSKDTNTILSAIFLQPVGFSTDEVPRRNFSMSELTFHMDRKGSQSTTNKEALGVKKVKPTEMNPQNPLDMCLALLKKNKDEDEQKSATPTAVQRANYKKPDKKLRKSGKQPPLTVTDSRTKFKSTVKYLKTNLKNRVSIKEEEEEKEEDSQPPLGSEAEPTESQK